jgi:hypothetical protein
MKTVRISCENSKSTLKNRWSQDRQIIAQNDPLDNGAKY